MRSLKIALSVMVVASLQIMFDIMYLFIITSYIYLFIIPDRFEQF
jgi:hypothetical protein